MSAYYEGRRTVGQLRATAEGLANDRPGFKFISGARVDNNTYLAHYLDGTTRLILHRTPIITTAPDGTITVRTGGWNTHTTRDRLNKFLPRGWGVYTSRGDLYLSRYLGNGERQAPIPFSDTATIAPDDTVTPDVRPSDLLADRALIDRFMEHVRQVGLPTAEASGGDPWIFSLDQLDAEIARDWLDSLYWTRRCYTLALEKAGMGAMGISLMLAMADRNAGKLDKCDHGRVRRLMRWALGKAS